MGKINASDNSTAGLDRSFSIHASTRVHRGTMTSTAYRQVVTHTHICPSVTNLTLPGIAAEGRIGYTDPPYSRGLRRAWL